MINSLNYVLPFQPNHNFEKMRRFFLKVLKFLFLFKILINHCQDIILDDDKTCSSIPVDTIDVEIPKGANPDGRPPEVTSNCLDRHVECVEFKEAGECSNNPG
jgi:hypothetical protein